MEEMQSFYTFKEGRKCLKCKSPIPDQVHKARKYCVTKRLPDGTVASCKDDYHSPIRKQRNEPFQKIALHHKVMHERIDQLLKAKGNIVTKEWLNTWGVILHRPFEFRIEDGKFNFYYHQFLIIEVSNNQYKISKHGLF
jgi:hypothetical protein